ncbi:bifunctional 2-polyprenyl-6-hydroxyphenol methylase/3-demethylubiquinol 3-O-methyltransferase UbiG [Telluribacter sp. SYSU D00476]|uniref:class I SAM-dependent methyltransferase n=1 Tax=Telluribacter sp. SYSU D00476 TaxID=2811430 RepID=UPI001FF11E17|nr:class I SAM-dependent methyltransferase [Telluribacter sp. SYSU D00476]
MNTTLQQVFGNIDIYLFDQLLKGRFDLCRNVLDAGCGGGRNLVYFLQNGFEVYGIDLHEQAVREVQQLAQLVAPQLPPTHFQVAPVEDMPFPDHTFDLVICSAVLHFAQDEAHFDAMVRSLWRVLAPGGYLFARLASTIGIEDRVVSLGSGRYYLPDGSERYLVDEQTLLSYTEELGGELFEPIKTTNVQNLRCMTTWCVRKI